MGKRSSFPKIPKDQYMTIDKRAVLALLPFLPPESHYAEPCYGNGDLESWLLLNGHICEWASDIEPRFNYVVQKDVLELDKNDLSSCDIIITNPPWSRPILHKLIEHLSNLKPTWLLFDSDWIHTRQSSELVSKYLTDIVSIGRLVWIPDTRISGKDNCCWYRFDKNKDHNKGIIFHGRN